MAAVIQLQLQRSGLCCLAFGAEKRRMQNHIEMLAEHMHPVYTRVAHQVLESAAMLTCFCISQPRAVDTLRALCIMRLFR